MGTKKRIRGLCCITPDAATAAGHVRAGKAACAGGADMLQFRAKCLSPAERVKAAFALKAAARRRQVLFIVNDDLPLALYTGADGVHLGQGDLPVKAAKDLLRILGRKRFIVGASARNVKEAVQAQKDGADYVGVGPVYATPLKAGVPPVGEQTLSRVALAVKIPVMAIGGINSGNARRVLNAGADAVAVIRAVCGAGRDIAGAARRLKDILEQRS